MAIEVCPNCLEMIRPPFGPQFDDVGVPEAVGVDALGDSGLSRELGHQVADIGPPQLARSSC